MSKRKNMTITADKQMASALALWIAQCMIYEKVATLRETNLHFEYRPDGQNLGASYSKITIKGRLTHGPNSVDMNIEAVCILWRTNSSSDWCPHMFHVIVRPPKYTDATTRVRYLLSRGGWRAIEEVDAEKFKRNNPFDA